MLPVSIQSMITTDPVHTEKAIAEINRLADAGCEVVRVAVPTMESAKALKTVRAGITIPLIADIHFDYKLALEAIDNNVEGLQLIQAISVERIRCWPLLKRLNLSKFNSYWCQCWFFTTTYIRRLWRSSNS